MLAEEKKNKRSNLIFEVGVTTASSVAEVLAECPDYKKDTVEVKFIGRDCFDEFFLQYERELTVFQAEHRFTPRVDLINHPKIAALSVLAFQKLGAEKFFQIVINGEIDPDNMYLDWVFADFVFTYTSFYLRALPTNTDRLIRRDFYTCVIRKWPICPKWGSWGTTVFAKCHGKIDPNEINF